MAHKYPKLFLVISYFGANVVKEKIYNNLNKEFTVNQQRSFIYIYKMTEDQKQIFA